VAIGGGGGSCVPIPPGGRSALPERIAQTPFIPDYSAINDGIWLIIYFWNSYLINHFGQKDNIG
jgi:hypothetical protein